MGRVIEGFQRTFKFAAILGGSEEIMADLGIRQAMVGSPLLADRQDICHVLPSHFSKRFYPKTAKL